jgi:hypothetical protein
MRANWSWCYCSLYRRIPKKLLFHNGLLEFLFSEFFWVIYSQIAPKIMERHQVFSTKTHKNWMKKPNEYQIFPKMDENYKFWMKISHMCGCKAFSIQNINECRKMWLHHNTFCCQPSISSKKKTKKNPVPLNLICLQSHDSGQSLWFWHHWLSHDWKLIYRYCKYPPIMQGWSGKQVYLDYHATCSAG